MTTSDKKEAAKGGGGPTGGGGPKGPHWTLDKIRALPDADVKGLKANAERRAAQSVAEMCEVVLLERRPQKSIVDGAHPKAKRTPLDREQEKAAVSLLLGVASALSSKYDLSEQSLLGKTGQPKVGGNQIKGLLNFNRYISYRRNDEIFSLLVWKSPDLGGPLYEVGAPSRYLKNPQPISYGPDEPLGPIIGSTKHSEAFSTFEEAAGTYSALIEMVANERGDVNPSGS